MFAILSRFACHFLRTPNFGNNQSFKALTCDGKKVFAKSNLEQLFARITDMRFKGRMYEFVNSFIHLCIVDILKIEKY